MNIKDSIILFYLDWMNSHLSDEEYAAHCNITLEELNIILNCGIELKNAQ